MRIDINLDALWASVRQMGAQSISVDLDVDWGPEVEFDKQLSSTGVEISLDDLVSVQGLLSVQGRQVLLFIPDHGSRVLEALTDGSAGKKFHIAHCRTLDDMKRRNRFERYTVTNNQSGAFEIYGYDLYKKAHSGETRLNVCKNCLKHLNYKNAQTANLDSIVNSFDIPEFFSKYSSLFKQLPKNTGHAHQGYTQDWKDLSIKTRQTANYTCQTCRVNLSGHKHLLHVHHRNGVKSDNSPDNLVSLCADCHQQEDFHDHMVIPYGDRQLINRLRREQQLTVF